MKPDQFCERCAEIVETSGTGWFGRYAKVGGERIHYVEAGAGEAVLLLHGFMAWSYTWRKNLPAISAGARAIALDFRGFGLSERSPGRGHSLSDQAELLRAFMDELGINRAVLCGNSMGGEVALRFALRYPDRVRALVLVAASGYIQRRARPLEHWLGSVPFLWSLWIRAVVMNRSFAGRTLRAAFRRPELVAEHEVDGYLLPATLPGAPASFAATMRDLDFGKMAAQWPQIRHRALLIWGAQDPWVPPAHGERLARELPGATLTIFPECGHLPHEECPDQFNRTVLAFLESLREP